MTLKTRFHTLSPMWTDGQRQYLNDVLGVSADAFAASELLPSVLVLTPGLSPEEGTLLSKILASIQLTEYLHIQTPEVSGGQLPDGMSAKHVLAFFGHAPSGRSEIAETVWWSLPPLHEMLGGSAAVVEKKRSVWGLLQTFAKECKV